MVFLGIVRIVFLGIFSVVFRGPNQRSGYSHSVNPFGDPADNGFLQPPNCSFAFFCLLTFPKPGGAGLQLGALIVVSLWWRWCGGGGGGGGGLFAARRWLLIAS